MHRSEQRKMAAFWRCIRKEWHETAPHLCIAPRRVDFRIARRFRRGNLIDNYNQRRPHGSPGAWVPRLSLRLLPAHPRSHLCGVAMTCDWVCWREWCGVRGLRSWQRPSPSQTKQPQTSHKLRLMGCLSTQRPLPMAQALSRVLPLAWGSVG